MQSHYSREGCLSQASQAYRKKVLGVSAALANNANSRGFAARGTNAFPQGIDEAIEELIDTVIEHDKARAAREVQRIRVTGRSSGFRPFNPADAATLVGVATTVIRETPALIRQDKRLNVVHREDEVTLRIHSVERRITTEYEALADEYQRDVSAAEQQASALMERASTDADTAGKRINSGSDRSEAGARLLSVFTNGLADDRIQKALTALEDDTLTTNEKLEKIDRLLRFPATASAEQLGQLLFVTKQAVLKTEWWIRHRRGEKANEIGRRRNIHKERAAQLEPAEWSDEDE